MMSNEDSTDIIDYPRQTSEWGRNLIDVLNIQFEKIQHQFDCVNQWRIQGGGRGLGPPPLEMLKV